MFKRTMLLGVAALTFGFALPLQAQDAPADSGQAPAPGGGAAPAATPEEIKEELLEKMNFARSKTVEKAGESGDVPTAGASVKVESRDPADPNDGSNDSDDEPEPEPDAEPPEEPDSEPPVEDEEPPTFFGEPVAGNFVFILDRSGSMRTTDSGSGPIEDSNGGIISNPDRMVIVKSEAIKVLSQLAEDDEFAIVTFGGGSQGEWTWYPARVKASSGNVQSAIAEIGIMDAYGATPAYTALKKGCELYNAAPGLDKMYFLCDGSPNSDTGAPGGNGNASNILADFPGWWSAGPGQSGCSLICVHIGTSGAAGQFMQALANLTGGIYTHH